jgi:hypothetical protein
MRWPVSSSNMQRSEQRSYRYPRSICLILMITVASAITLTSFGHSKRVMGLTPTGYRIRPG